MHKAKNNHVCPALQNCFHYITGHFFLEHRQDHYKKTKKYVSSVIHYLIFAALNPIIAIMKKSYMLISLMIASFFAIISCEEVENLLDVKFNATFEASMDIVVQPETLKSVMTGVFYAADTIDPMSNSDYAEYVEKIKEINVEEATVEITSLSEPATLLTTTLTVSSDGFTPAVWTFTDLALEVGTTVDLDNSNGQWDTIQAMLDSQQLIYVEIEGTADPDDFQFTIQITIGTEIIANPL
jgi:hypothetical protein